MSATAELRGVTDQMLETVDEIIKQATDVTHDLRDLVAELKEQREPLHRQIAADRGPGAIERHRAVAALLTYAQDFPDPNWPGRLSERGQGILQAASFLERQEHLK